MTVKADIHDGKIYLDSSYSDKELCKTVPGSKWDRERGMWNVRLSWSSCKQLRGIFGPRLEIGPELMDWASEEFNSRISPSTELRTAMDVENNALMEGLYAFQRAGAKFLFTAQHALLGDDVGSGKTIQVLAAARQSDSLPALVVCPSSVKRNWAREAARWFPECTPYVIEGTAAKRNKKLKEAAEDPTAFVVINFESVRLHSRLAPYGSIALTVKERTPGPLNTIPFKLVVCDEAHRLQHPQAKQTRAVWAVGHSPSVNFRWALSGTPITNNPASLWSILHFLEPNEWPGRTAFIDRYTLSSFNVWGGLEVFGLNPNTQEELFQIFDPRFRRIPKEVALPQLPPIIHETRLVEMHPKQQKAYDTMSEKLVAQLDEGILIARNPISQITRLVQLSSSSLEELVDDEGNQIVDADGNFRYQLCDPSNKLDAVMDDIPDFSEPIIIFAESRQLLEMLSKRLEKAGLEHAFIKGGQSADIRQNNIDAFQNGKVDIVLVVIKAGGTGINLHRSRLEIFLQRPYSNVDYKQAIGRGHRIGSEIFDSVLVIHYITPDSIEERIVEILETKAEHLEEVVRDRDSIRKLLGR